MIKNAQPSFCDTYVKRLNLKTSVSSMRTSLGYWTSGQWH